MFRAGSPVPRTEQPRPAENDARQPSAAERVRTLAEHNASAALTIPGAQPGGPPEEPGSGLLRARAVTDSGELMLLLPAHAPAARAAAHARDDELTCVLELTDVAPVAVPNRVRGRAWVAGWLTAVAPEEHGAAIRLLAERQPRSPVVAPGWQLLRLEVGEAHADDLWGAGHVEPEEFAGATADPLAPHEAELLQHLDAAHGGQLRSLCTLLGDDGRGCGAWQRITPLALDRFGLRLRLTAEGHCCDARFDFPEPVRDVAELRAAMRQLFDAAAR